MPGPVRRGAFADAEAAANGAYLTHVVDVNDEDFARDERFFKWDKLHFTPEGQWAARVGAAAGRRRRVRAHAAACISNKQYSGRRIPGWSIDNVMTTR